MSPDVSFSYFRLEENVIRISVNELRGLGCPLDGESMVDFSVGVLKDRTITNRTPHVVDHE